MRFLDGFTVTAMLVAVFAPPALACTATSTVDTAKKERDTDHYRNARDVATEVIDQERFDRDEDSIESATGTLLVEKAKKQVDMSGGSKKGDDYIARYNTGAGRDAYRALLNEETEQGHGILSDGTVVGYASDTPSTVRDHMRLHLWQWYQTNRGLNPSDVINEHWNAGASVSVIPLPGGPVPVTTPAPAPDRPEEPASSTPSAPSTKPSRPPVDPAPWQPPAAAPAPAGSAVDHAG